MKFALKLPQLNRNWLMLGGALVLGVVAIGLSNKVLSDKMAALDEEARNSQQLVQVVVPKQSLPRGAPIDPSVFALRAVPAKYVHSAVDPERFMQLAGQKLAAPLEKGETLLNVHVEPPIQAFSATLANGNRALTTEVDEVNSISGMLRPTDRIDLMATARGTGPGSREVTFPLLSNVEVLATGQVTRQVERQGGGEGEEGQEEQTFTTITLSLSPQDAQRLVVAKASGKLTAVLRNPEDSAPSAIAALGIDDVLPTKQAVKARGLAVQYIIGGQG